MTRHHPLLASPIAFRRLALTAAATLSSVATASAEPAPIILRLADGMPSGHVIDRLVIEPFMKDVAARTHGQVVFQHFPAEQLGKSRDLLIMTQRGATDIGFIVPSYISDRMPLTSVTELPGMFQTTCQGNAALRALTADGAILDQNEFRPNGIRPLIIFLMPAYQLELSSSRRFESLADVEGLKIRTPGGAMDLTVMGIGAVPIRVSPPQIYESLSRGTIDGALLSYQSVTSYHLPGLLKSGTIGQDFGTVAITFSIAAPRLQALPEAVQAALKDAGRAISDRACADFDKAEQDSIAQVRAKGVRLVVPTVADRGRLDEAFAAIRTQWAVRLDARGKPGSAVLAAFAEAAASAKAP